MEEQASWKGHSFTLLVFAGIVFLCSIFFVLGMLVGRSQGQRAADTAVAVAAAKAVATEAQNDAQARASTIAPFEGVETGQASNKASAPVAAPDPDPVKPLKPVKPAKIDPPSAAAPAKPAPKPAPAAVPASAPVKMIYLQVAALEKEAAAGKEIDELRKKGFSALMASSDGTHKVYRVQVGPFSNAADAETAKNKLEALGYKPIRK